jgi:MFS family permease
VIASRTGLLVASTGVALGAAALALIPAQIPGESLAALGDMRSPAFFPVLAALLCLAAGLALIPAAFRPEEEPAPPHPRRAMTLAVLLTGGAVLTPVLGGLLVIFLLMPAVGWLLGDRRPLRMLLLAAVSVGIVHLLFERTLKVMLPPGMLF